MTLLLLAAFALVESCVPSAARRPPLPSQDYGAPTTSTLTTTQVAPVWGLVIVAASTALVTATAVVAVLRRPTPRHLRLSGRPSR
ncbi:MAG: hypothetical protein ABJA87_02070 [bacterium]